MFDTLKTVANNYAGFLFNRFFPFAVIALVVYITYQITLANEHWIHDEFMSFTAKSLPESPVTLITIDDASLYDIEKKEGAEHFNENGWAKPGYLKTFEKILKQQPAVLAFDGLFFRLDPKQDQSFIKALQPLEQLIIGHSINNMGSQGSKIPEYYALNLGVINLETDNDGIIRKQQPIYQQLHYDINAGVRGLYPNIAVASLLKYLDFVGTHPELVQPQSQAEKEKPKAAIPTGWMLNLVHQDSYRYLSIFPEGNINAGQKIPLDDDNQIIMRWLKPERSAYGPYDMSHYEIPVCRFFDACTKGPKSLTPLDLEKLKHRIVILGSGSLRNKDFYRTPLSKTHWGPDILATTLDNLYFGLAMKDESQTIYQFLYVGLICITIFFFRYRLERMGPVFLYSFGLMVVYFWMAQQNFEQGKIINILTPEVFMILAFAGGSFYREFVKERQVRKLEKNMSQLVSKAVFNEIQKKEFILQAGGERLEITSMFVDLRNFTGLSENLSPNEVTDILNEFYTEVERVVFDYNGTIDKFMGDGVLVMFGAPLPSINQYTDAFLAAKTIIERLDKLLYLWDKEKKIKETMGLQINVGISISSGSAFVGFLGPASKLEFTAVGDCVNLTVRLQEQIKIFNSRLILSEYTFNGLSTEFQSELRPLGQVKVRGRETPLTIYGLTPSRRVIHSRPVQI